MIWIPALFPCYYEQGFRFGDYSGEDFEGISAGKEVVDRFADLSEFLLCIGTLEIRKNQGCLLNAYRLLTRKYPQGLTQLVLVGRKGWIDGNIEFQVANDRELARRVQVITDVGDIELEGLYRR